MAFHFTPNPIACKHETVWLEPTYTLTWLLLRNWTNKKRTKSPVPLQSIYPNHPKRLVLERVPNSARKDWKFRKRSPEAMDILSAFQQLQKYQYDPPKWIAEQNSNSLRQISSLIPIKAYLSLLLIIQPILPQWPQYLCRAVSVPT